MYNKSNSRIKSEKVGFDFCSRLFQTTGVTLACEDDHQIEAHKVVLADIFLMLITVGPTEVPRTTK